MSVLGRMWRAARRGTASVEFAVSIPVVLILVGWFYDLSNVLVARIKLSNAVDNAAEYALLKGSGVSTTVLQGVVTSVSGLTGASAAASGPACYCVNSSTTPSSTTAATCGATCSNGTTAGSYYTITGSYTYVPLLPALSHLTNTAVSASAMVRIN